MERRQHFNQEPGAVGEMSVEYDIAAGYVRSYAAGFWSVDQARTFFADWQRVVRAIHQNGLPVFALVDMAEGTIQKVEVADIITTATAGLYRPGDAIAMLVPTSLTKMQMRRVLDPRFHEFFLSRNAAQTWLDAKARATPQRTHAPA